MQIIKNFQKPNGEEINLTELFPVWIICLISISISTILCFHFWGIEPVISGDAVFYLSSETDILSAGEDLFSGRVLTPFIVSLLPCQPEIGFTFISFISLTGAGIIFYMYLRQSNFRPYISLLGLLLFILSPVFIYTSYHTISVDPLFWIFWILGWYGIITRSFLLCSISLIVGVFQKEAILGLIPPWLLEWAPSTKGRIAQLVIICLACILLLGIKLILHLNSGYSLPYFISMYAYHASQLFGLFRIPIMFFLPFGMLWIIAAYGIVNKHIFPMFHVQTYVWTFAYVAILSIIATGVHRMAFLLFPLIIPYSLTVIPFLSAQFSKFVSIGSFVICLASISAGIAVAYPEPLFISCALFHLFILFILWQIKIEARNQSILRKRRDLSIFKSF